MKVPSGRCGQTESKRLSQAGLSAMNGLTMGCSKGGGETALLFNVSQ